MKTIDQIQKAICTYTGISEQELTDKSRKENTILAKTLFCWFVSACTIKCSKEIAEYVNLSMAAYWGAIRRYKVWYQYDKSFRKKANEIEELLK